MLIQKVKRPPKTEIELEMVDGKPQTLTVKNLERFLLGELTLAQVQGITMEQAYAYAQLGYNVLQQGKLEDARKVFEGLVVLNPYDAYFHSVLGSVLARQENKDRALKEFTIAINLESQDPYVFVNRAELLLEREQYDDALEDLNMAIKLDKTGKHPAIQRAKTLLAATKKRTQGTRKKAGK